MKYGVYCFPFKRWIYGSPSVSDGGQLVTAIISETYQVTESRKCNVTLSGDIANKYHRIMHTYMCYLAAVNANSVRTSRGHCQIIQYTFDPRPWCVTGDWITNWYWRTPYCITSHVGSQPTQSITYKNAISRSRLWSTVLVCKLTII